jgi:hypothetical protein
MFNRTQLPCLVVGALFVLGGFGMTARADELTEHLGPVRTNDTILATFGNKRVIAFLRDNGHCAVSAIVFDRADADNGETTAARIRIRLKPHEMVHIDSSDNRTLDLQCGSHAATLEIPEGVASGRALGKRTGASSFDR